jgi:hypothetical protein
MSAASELLADPVRFMTNYIVVVGIETPDIENEPGYLANKVLLAYLEDVSADRPAQPIEGRTPGSYELTVGQPGDKKEKFCRGRRGGRGRCRRECPGGGFRRWR